MSRLGPLFEQLKSEGRRAVIPYLVAGDPNEDLTVPLMHALVDAGADIIEVGVPFSDPMSEGPTIQKGHERALEGGTSLKSTLALVEEFRRSNATTPLVLMGYANPLERQGYSFVADACADAGGALAPLRIASFMRRDGRAHAYGVDSRARGYSYAGTVLIDWMIDRLRNQEGADDTPLEPVGRYLDAAGRPDHALIGIGATRYTDFGESTYLVRGDESIVIVYDERDASPEAVAAAVEAGAEDTLPSASVLRQRVE